MGDNPLRGALAQLGERLLCTQEVSGSIPLGSMRNCLGNSASSDEMAALRAGDRGAGTPGASRDTNLGGLVE
jgi:hypothetical protein